ncbi:MAG: glycosyltransferase family 39 protein [Deltaproteobacteria bacterium]|nr:glycosyltransferase family 39 protein [Deltaproteobacteria bacterium]
MPEIAEPNAVPQSHGKYLTWAALLGLIALALYLAFRFTINALPLQPDEADVIFGPEWSVSRGLPSSAGIYPGFPHLFFSFFSSIFTPFLPKDPIIAPWVVSRAINLALYGLNIAIFFLASRNFLSRPWAFLAALVFALSPGVFFSAIFVKTESLLLLGICASLFFGGRLADDPQQIRWHALLGVCAGLTVAVKFNPFPVLVWAAALWLARDRIDFRRSLSATGIFILAALASTALMWPGIFDLSAYSAQRFKIDIYFENAPSAFRGVDELFAFPYGRFSYGLCLILPFAAGPLNYLAALVGLMFSAAPKRVLALWGIASACYLLAALWVTLIRPAWLFTPAIPVISIGCVFFWKRIWEGFGKTGMVAAFVGMALVVAVSFYQYPAAAMGINETIKAQAEGLAEAFRLSGQGRPLGRDDVLLLTNSGLAVHQRYAAQSPSKTVMERRPQYILVLDSYLKNFCKYRKNPGYAVQCAFFGRLMEGREGYSPVWTRRIDFPLRSWSPDPEGSMTVRLLRRNGQPPAKKGSGL